MASLWSMGASKNTNPSWQSPIAEWVVTEWVYLVEREGKRQWKMRVGNILTVRTTNQKTV